MPGRRTIFYLLEVRRKELLGLDFFCNLFCVKTKKLNMLQPYPNPVNDQLVCEFITANSEDISLTLVNGLGKVVHKTAYSNHFGYQKQTIDVSEFSQGVYFCKFALLMKRRVLRLK